MLRRFVTIPPPSSSQKFFLLSTSSVSLRLSFNIRHQHSKISQSLLFDDPLKQSWSLEDEEEEVIAEQHAQFYENFKTTSLKKNSTTTTKKKELLFTKVLEEQKNNETTQATDEFTKDHESNTMMTTEQDEENIMSNNEVTKDHNNNMIISPVDGEPQLSMEAVLESFEIEYPSRVSLVKVPNLLKSATITTPNSSSSSSSSSSSPSSSTIPVKSTNAILSRLLMDPKDSTIHDNNVIAIPFRPKKTSDLELAMELAARVLLGAKAITNTNYRNDPSTPILENASTMLMSRPKYLFDFELVHDLLEANPEGCMGPYVVAAEILKGGVRRSKILTTRMMMMTPTPQTETETEGKETDEKTKKNKKKISNHNSKAVSSTKVYSAREITIRGVIRNSTSGKREATAMMTFHV